MSVLRRDLSRSGIHGLHPGAQRFDRETDSSQFRAQVPDSVEIKEIIRYMVYTSFLRELGDDVVVWRSGVDVAGGEEK